MFDERAYRLFEEITVHDKISEYEVMRVLNLTERQFQYDFDKVNDALQMMNLPVIRMEEKIFLVDNVLKKRIEIGMPLNINANQFVIPEETRSLLICLYTYIRSEALSNYHYQLLLGVSKNTALTDVKKAKIYCEEWDISLVYSRREGYHFEGTENRKWQFVSYCIDYLLSQPIGKELIILVIKAWRKEVDLVLVQQAVDELIKKSNLKLVKSRKAEMIFHILFVKLRNKTEKFRYTEFEKRLLQRQLLFENGKQLAISLFNEENGMITYFLTIQLLITREEIEDKAEPFLDELAGQIIEEFEKNTLLPMHYKKQLKSSLYDHLVPAFFRITFGIPLVNPMVSRIKIEYADLFEFVKRALNPLSALTGKLISETEISFFTLHFGSYLEKNKKKEPEKINALIVCSNGVSTSIMLRSQLQDMFSHIQFSRVHTIEQIQHIPITDYDLIFSTIEVISIKPVYRVKPLLTDIEKNNLIQSVANQFPRLNLKNISIDQLMKIIHKYTEVKDEEKMLSELINLIHSGEIEKESYKPMLSELLTKDMIQFANEEMDWKKAIAKAAQPLVDFNKVQSKYVEAMIKNVEEIGTYIHIGKGIAIPHARPEAGVNSLGISFLRTTTPVLLLDKEEHKIDIFICLAAIDNQAHLKALAQITKLLSNDTTLNAIKNSTTVEEIISIIKKGEDE
ncbi:BglG family transcription antiterminator [Carnobacterium pleistocenium]|uniref:BglG family transcription antiterminator n=1 Tax=Carnobacterium pleistocenium TaxID=181073 RepID=UPI0005598815|nr:BglG family transcription antiterminator [Carnobacterium pleistocenium]